MKIAVGKEGPLSWRYEARGVLTRPVEGQHIIIFAGGTYTFTGLAFTRWGAIRKARRKLQWYCGAPTKFEEVPYV